MSRRNEAKRARRKKRQSARNETWISEQTHQRLVDELEIASELEAFADRLEERGWVVSEDEDDRDDVIWFYPPSHVDDDLDDDVVEATVVVLSAADDGEVAHVIFVGTQEHYEFDLDELFDHIDTVEAYRVGDPLPQFDSE